MKKAFQALHFELDGDIIGGFIIRAAVVRVFNPNGVLLSAQPNTI